MATNRTPQQIADAARKRAATQAANRAAGIPTVRQARAAARAAKAGQPYTPPAPRSSGRRRNRRFAGQTWSNPTPQAPIFATPKPNYRAAKLTVLVALEAFFVVKCTEKGVTDEVRNAYATYKKVKALALGKIASAGDQNEADSALRLATVQLVKLTF